MKIHHIAIWTGQIETLAAFYCRWFGCTTNEGYYNPTKQFTSKYIYFENGCSLELMNQPGLQRTTVNNQIYGYAHIAISTGSKANVDALTRQMELEGIVVKSQPRVTGDGFYESIVIDPDGNLIEITE